MYFKHTNKHGNQNFLTNNLELNSLSECSKYQLQRVSSTEVPTTTEETTTLAGPTHTPVIDTTTPEPICVWNGIEYEFGKNIAFIIIVREKIILNH